ncbi:hypothetical protein ACOME3_008778 [Neoechinorhynchus agilis]
MIGVRFEVFGKVQGVFFRKCSKDQALRLGVNGWIRNTNKNTVDGYLEGPKEHVESMMEWLRNKGSPMSKITKAEFRDKRDIIETTMSTFEIRKYSFSKK